ncbi:hypothetical protein L1887_31249 [Cichorium endivia]|nr:hypothetical protein L1887_31249 [Cichorium endivia]
MEELGLELVSLLRTAWILATLPILIACLPLPGLGWFHRTLLGFAKRGKIQQSNSILTVPQRFFSHFYLVAIFWTTILLIAVWFYAIKMLPSLIEQDLFSHAFPLNKSLSTKQHVYDVWLSVFLLLLMEAQVFCDAFMRHSMFSTTVHQLECTSLVILLVYCKFFICNQWGKNLCSSLIEVMFVTSVSIQQHHCHYVVLLQLKCLIL